MIRARAAVIVAVLFAGAACTPNRPTTAAQVRPAIGAAERDYRAGNDFAARGDWVRAEQYFASALRRGHPEEEVVPKLLRVCLGASRLRTALGYAQLHLLRHPDAWSLRYLSATILLALGQVSEARHEIEQVIRVEPRHPASLFLLAEITSRDALAVDQARTLYERYLQLEPSGPHAHDARSFLYAHDARLPTSDSSEKAAPP